jgi:hypothetical protein
MNFNIKAKLSALVLALAFGGAHAGPIIIAGTDADDHGSANATTNFTGWLFMQKAFENLAPAVTNGSTSVVCIGCNAGQAGNAFTSATSKSSIAGSWTFTALTSTTDISNFFNGTGASNVNNTGIVYMPTVEFNVSGGISDTQLAIVNANATALNTYVANGGGLFTQEQVNSSIGYNWLTTLLPGLIAQGDSGGPAFDSGTLDITAQGNAAFPGLTDSDVTNATPWHAWFSGNFGGLSPLVTGPIFGPTGTFDGAVVLGGGAGTVIVDPNPVSEPGMLPLLAIGGLGALWGRSRARKAA